jgi:hypothetical protein
MTDAKEIARFSDTLKKMVRRRCRFTVFAGAGVSVPSGVPPAGSFLPAYLAHCISGWLFPKTGHQWRPEEGNWPPLAECDPEYRTKFEKELLDKLNDKPKPLERRLMLQALGTLQDWRDAIQFLSRARTDSDGIQRSLGPPESTIRDSFFHFIVKGREPSLAHRMIAALSEQLRISLVLTTNFDELIEAAFELTGIRLFSFDVHQDASPSFRSDCPRSSGDCETAWKPLWATCRSKLGSFPNGGRQA